MRFDFLPLRFAFIARDSLHFPPGKAANILRGALGVSFRQIGCAPDCQDDRTCPLRHSCPYGRIFAPDCHGEGPSGLADSPRPFVFRARHLDGQTIQPGQPFHFDLNVFSLQPDIVAIFIRTFTLLAQAGLGPRRGRADLERVTLLDSPEQLLDENTVHVEPVSLDLNPVLAAPRRLRVEFLTPTELKHQHHLAARPDFPILFSRIRDRISTLRGLYGQAPLPLDFQGIGARASAIALTSCDLRHLELERHSSRTGQTHGLGGFVGTADYEGDFTEFLPYLEAARWVGVGRQAVWGKGEIAVAHLP